LLTCQENPAEKEINKISPPFEVFEFLLIFPFQGILETFSNHKSFSFANNSYQTQSQPDIQHTRYRNTWHDSISSFPIFHRHSIFIFKLFLQQNANSPWQKRV
jgi:hypothetical protein